MIKIYEQQSKGKTVSVREIHEFISGILSEMGSKLKNGSKLAKIFESIISAELKDCKKAYASYLSLRKDVLKLAHERKKICEQLINSNEQLDKLVSDCKTICTGNNAMTITDFRKSNNKKLSIKEIETTVNDPKLSDGDFFEFKKLYNEGTLRLMDLCKIYTDSKKSLEADLKRLKKEGKIKSIVSATIKKKKLDKEKNREILIEYSEKVVPFLDEKLNKFKEMLKNSGLDPKKMKDVQAIEKMIEYWEKDYNSKKIKEACTDANYCRNLGSKLSKVCNNYGISMTNDIPTLFMQLSTRLTMMLKDFNSKNVAFHKDSRNRISEWIEDFQQKYVEITKNFSEVRPVQSGNQKIIFPVNIVDFSNKIRNLSNRVESFSKELNSQFGEELQTISMQFTKICPSH